MNIATDPLILLETSDYQPVKHEIPPHSIAPPGLYVPALSTVDQAEAERMLRALVVYHLHFTNTYDAERQAIRQSSLCEAFREARVGLWWYAFAEDVTGGAFERVLFRSEYVTVERRRNREHVERWYGCTDQIKPPRVEDMQEAARRRVNKLAKSRGIVPWQKQGKPVADDPQSRLF